MHSEHGCGGGCRDEAIVMRTHLQQHRPSVDVVIHKVNRTSRNRDAGLQDYAKKNALPLAPTGQ